MLPFKALVGLAVAISVVYGGIFYPVPEEPDEHVRQRIEENLHLFGQQFDVYHWFPVMKEKARYKHGKKPGDHVVYLEVRKNIGDDIQRAIDYSDDTFSREKGLFNFKPRVVYIPTGQYYIKKPIRLRHGVILMGHPRAPPGIIPYPGFKGDSLITCGDKEPLHNVALKHLSLSSAYIAADKNFTVVSWRAAPGSYIQNLGVVMEPVKKDKPHDGHVGIHMNGGSALSVTDFSVKYGRVGVWHDNHEQAEYKKVLFESNEVALLADGGKAIVVTQAEFKACKTNIVVRSGDPWVGLVDAKARDSGITLYSNVRQSFLLERIKNDNYKEMASFNKTRIVAGKDFTYGASYGSTIGRDPPVLRVQDMFPEVHRRNMLALYNKDFPVVPAPYYSEYNEWDHFHVFQDKSHYFDAIDVTDRAQNGGYDVYGDNSRDEAPTLNKVLKYVAGKGMIAYFPFGTYRVESTLMVPPGSRIYGEAWATIVASGSFFKNEDDPQAVVSLGLPGEVGVAQIQDMRFTVAEPLPGAVMLHVCMTGPEPGDVGIWNSMVTIGGLPEFPAMEKECSDPDKPCKAAFIGLLTTRRASAYIDNLWNWVADRSLEGAKRPYYIAAKGGMLVDSNNGMWLHSVSTEHWWTYQMHLDNVDGLHMSMVRGVTSPFQGREARVLPPAPWKPNANYWSDYDFRWCGGAGGQFGILFEESLCRMAPATIFTHTKNVHAYGLVGSVGNTTELGAEGRAGTREPCAYGYDCQELMHVMRHGPVGPRVFGVYSQGARTVLELPRSVRVAANATGFAGMASGAGLVGRYTPPRD